MSELQDVRKMLAMAETAATAGDLTAADESLRAVARIQEAELGPLHPDLANTLNNLAIVAEKAGRPGDAETFYRRAVAIASASLPADDPMLAASRQNLEDFCRARGLPIDGPAVVASPTQHDESTQPSPPPSITSVPVLRTPAPTALRRPSRPLATVGIGVIVLVTAALLVIRPWSSRETRAPAPTSTAESGAPQAAEPVRTQPAPPVPIERAQPSTTARGNDDRGAVTDKPTAPGRSSGAITLATVQLCRTFSTSGDNWKCDPAGNSVTPGQLVLYTRVKSPRDAVVVHRWYRGNTLRQAVRLEVRASATEGYRTYSRQTVHSGEDWRVEVRSAAGDLLHEQRLTVR
jgi:Tetratricopeptide repeat/Protein of unknown function (DUF2914)